jgi:hypothetical protein
VKILRQLFERIREAKITVKPSKCMIGMISFTCHVVGKGQIQMDKEATEIISWFSWI